MMLYFLIPAYNEEPNIGRLLLRLQQGMEHWGWPPERYGVYVVNDGSTDGTREAVLSFAQRGPLRLIDHPRNLGVDRAFKTGFEAVLGQAQDDDLLVTMEADNTSDLAVLAEMLRHARAGTDLVLASCYAPGGGVVGTTPLRMLLSKIANGLLYLLFPIPGVHTYSSFYRIYRVGALRAGYQAFGERLMEEKGFVCVVELLINLARLPLSLSEVPMLLQGDQRRGPSKMRILRTIWGYLRLMAKLKLRPAMAAPYAPMGQKGRGSDRSPMGFAAGKGTIDSGQAPLGRASSAETLPSEREVEP